MHRSRKRSWLFCHTFAYLIILSLIGCKPITDRLVTYIPTGEAQFPIKRTAPLSSSLQTPVVVQVKTVSVTPKSNNGDSCESIASVGIPLDVTIVDGTHFYPGESFSKTWRLKNSGSCTWTSDFAVVWFFGDRLSPVQERFLKTSVEPGRTIDITIDMIAPDEPGVYRSYWKLRDNEGGLFGIGPKGLSAFWVSIGVVELVQPTSTVPPSPTPVEIVYISGSVVLNVGDYLDIDTGEINQLSGSDILFNLAANDRLALHVVNDMKLAKSASLEPGFLDCARNFEMASDPVLWVDDMVLFQSYCVITDNNLPGYIKVKNIDLSAKQMELEYLLWAIP